MSGSREAVGPDFLSKNHKSKRVLSIIGSDPLKNHKAASIQYKAIIGPPVNGVSKASR